ncbi:hypothetical protein FRB93_008026 [Tulasnella sp. JGI-2019a]|nr:hypothetical protein FRB93_008026 [Tulasnella sp. JGI-2019a]
MTSICLSVISNLRCTNLTHWQDVILIIVSSIDLAFAAKFLSVNWRHMRQLHWALVLEIIIYFFLSLFDYLLRENEGAGLDLASFTSYDEAVGILTTFSLFAFMSAILLLAHLDVIPLTFRHEIRRPTIYGLILLIPCTLVLNVVAGLVGITYVQSTDIPWTIIPSYASYAAQFTPNLLGDLAGILLALFQLIVAGSCFFYIYQTRARGVGGGVISGMKTTLQQGFVLYPKEPAMPRGHTSIQPNPIVVHSQSYDNNINIRPVSFGLSDAIEHVPTSATLRSSPGPSPLGQQQDQATSPRPPLPKRLSSNFFANFSSTPAAANKPKPQKIKPGFTPFKAEDLREATGIRVREMGWNQPGDRVTVQFPMFKSTNDDGSAAPPMLHLRFSTLDMPSPSQLIAAMSLQNGAESGNGATPKTNSTPSRAYHESQDLEQQQASVSAATDPSATRRSSMFGAGVGGFARAVQSRVQSSRLSTLFGGASAGTRTSMPAMMQSSIQPTISEIPRTSERMSLGLGVYDGGQWVPLTEENQQHLYPSPQSLQIQPTELDLLGAPNQRVSPWHHTAQRPSQSWTLSSGTTGFVSISASDVALTPTAQIVQARSVQVNTQMSTLLYSPQMSGIVNAQMLHDSPSSSPRRMLGLETPPSSSASPSPRQRMSEIPTGSPTSGAVTRPRATTLANGSRMAARERMRKGTNDSGETAYSNEDVDGLSPRPETLDVMGSRVRARTPTVISNSDTRSSVPLEHCWAATPVAGQVVEEGEEACEPTQTPNQMSEQEQGQTPSPSEQSSVRVLQQEFLRYEQNYLEGRRGNITEETTTYTVPPAYENHRSDQLAMNDRGVVAPNLTPPHTRARTDSGVMGALGDPL